MEKLVEVTISKEGNEFIGKIIWPNGDISEVRSESLEDILDHIANELEDRFGLF